MEARHITPTPIAAFGVGTLLVSWAVDNSTWSPPEWAITLAFIVGVLLLLISASIWVGNYLKARGRRTVMDLLRELYGWVGSPHPVVSLIVVVIICGSLGGVFWHLLGASHQKSIAEEVAVDVGTTKKPDHDNLPTTLKKLFESDFPESVKHHYTVTAFLGEPTEQIDVPVDVISNYAAETKFISFYVPFHSGATPEICMSVSEHFDDLFSRSKQQKFMLGRPGDSGDDGDFPLADVVYIYHEAPMDLQEMASVDTHYQEHGMRVHFRSQDYVSTRWLQEKVE